jgi:hypothetical protein
MNSLKEKPVALILSCKKPYYEARLQANLPTLQGLHDRGFEVVFLYGDPNLSHPTWTQDSATQFHTLTVPIQESYLFLSSKMELAFLILKDLGCKGVLKLDDNTAIHDWSCIEDFQTNILPVADYFGVDIGIWPKGVFPLNYSDFKLYSLRLHWVLSRETVYFQGPFYWLSNRMLSYIAEKHLTLPLEDLNVGYLVNEYPGAVKVLRPWFREKKISWGADKDPNRA